MVKRLKATPIPTASELAAGNLITRAKVVALIVSRDRGAKETDRSARDRVRKFLADHVSRRLLAEVKPGWFDVREVGRWLRQLCPDKFNDLPRTLVLHADTGSYVVSVGSAALTKLPGSVEDCRRLLVKQDADIRRLQSELDAANRRIRELEPIAQKLRNEREKASAAGKQGGRGKAYK